MLAEFDGRFPGFEHEVHGVSVVRDGPNGNVQYEVDCIEK